MGYCTLADLKAYIGTSKVVDDSLLTALIERASARIDTYCQRQFSATTETRRYLLSYDLEGWLLLLDKDLLAVTTLLNGAGISIPSNAYWLMPRNKQPAYGIYLRPDSGYYWGNHFSPYEEIVVTGSWGYSTTPPADIVHAAIRVAAWMYHQAEAPFETQGLPELGLVTVPADMPADIKALLDPYCYARVGSI